MEQGVSSPLPRRLSLRVPGRAWVPWVGSGVLLVVVVVLGVPAVWFALVELVPALALLQGIRLPAPLPVLGVPLAAEPAWGIWAVRSVSALVIPVVFAVWAAGARGRPASTRARVVGRAWGGTVVAVLVGSLLQAVLTSLTMPGGVLSYLLLLGGTVLVAVVVGVVLGVVVALVCGLFARG